MFAPLARKVLPVALRMTPNSLGMCVSRLEVTRPLSKLTVTVLTTQNRLTNLILTLAARHR